jgi:hypothetical protein
LVMTRSSVGDFLHDTQYSVIYAVSEWLGWANRLIPSPSY